jgi:hypothetical protein
METDMNTRETSEIRELTLAETDAVTGAAWADMFGGTDEAAEKKARNLELARNNVLGSTSRL